MQNSSQPMASYYFTAEDGVLGEACRGSENAKVKNIVWKDGTPSENVLPRITLCVLVAEDGVPYIGTNIWDQGLPYNPHLARTMARHVAVAAMP